MIKWLPIDGFDGYFASTTGQIKCIKSVYKNRNGRKTREKLQTENILSFQPNHSGYSRCSLSIKGKQSYFFVHRVIAKTFIPNPENKPFVNHINGIKNDNNVENLEWVSQSENEKHAHANGLKNHKGEKHPMAKLTSEIILKIRERLANGEKATLLAKEYNLSDGFISNVKSRKKWNHI